MTSVLRRWPVQLVLLLGLCALLFGVGLGSGGFIDTEGHRAVPGFEMLDTGNWLVPHMFERPYVRKPPGMPWAIAAFAAVLGPTELAARLVSAVAATGSVLAAWWFGRLWFGRWGGLAAGACTALTPWFWPLARHAEIEALNQLGTQLAALSLIHVMVVRGRRPRLATLLGALGVAVMLFAKGPAGIAVPIAAMVAACWVRRSFGPLRCTRVALIWLPALGLFAWWTLAVRSWLGSYHGPPAPVLQSPGSFLWVDPPLEIAALPLVAFGSALPGSLALLFPWGPDARAEGVRVGQRARGGLRRGYAAALTLAWAWVLAVAAWWAMGIGNPRYTLPAAVLVGPLAGWVVAGLVEHRGGGLSGKRPAIARLLLLGHPAAWAVVLLGGWLGYLTLYERGRRTTSGEEAGRTIAEVLSAHEANLNRSNERVLVYADGVVEARPEVVLELERAAIGRSVEVRWWPIDTVKIPPRSGVYLLVRSDDAGLEMPDVGDFPAGVRTVRIDGVQFHKYRADLVFVTDDP